MSEFTNTKFFNDGYITWTDESDIVKDIRTFCTENLANPNSLAEQNIILSSLATEYFLSRGWNSTLVSVAAWNSDKAHVLNWHSDGSPNNRNINFLLFFYFKDSGDLSGGKICFRNTNIPDSEVEITLTDRLCILVNQTSSNFQHKVTPLKYPANRWCVSVSGFDRGLSDTLTLKL